MIIQLHLSQYHLSIQYLRLILYSRGNYQELRDKIETHDWTFINDAPIDDVAKKFEEAFLGLVNECLPSKLVTIHTDDKPWYDFTIRKHSRLRDKLRKQALKSHNPAHWQAYKSARNKVNNLKKHAKELFYCNLEDNFTDTMSNNKQDFWKIVRHFVKENKSSGSIPPLVITNENDETNMYVTDHEKANCLNEYFTSILDQGLFSVPALVFDLAQLTSQKRFDGGYVIIVPSTTFLGTSYGQIVVAVFT